MRKTVLFLILISLVFTLCPAVYATSPNINAAAYILVDSKSGQTLYEYNADAKLYPASTTKIMTAILALEKGSLDQVMTASKAAVNDIGKDGMNIGIMDGEEMSMEDLLNAMLLSSANETANIIAENISPSRKEFVALMNLKAKELGATNTNFMNPCGAHDPNHYTTARDLLKIAKYAMTLPKFREIVNKDRYLLPSTNKHTTWGTLPITNKLINNKSDYYTKVDGIKTGSTGEAGNNFVASAVNRDGEELISVIMGVRGPAAEKEVFSDSKELLENGFRNFSVQRIANENEFVKNVPVADSNDNASLDLILQSNLDYLLPNDKSTWNIEENAQINTPVNAPVKQGDVLGYKEFKRNGVLLGKVNIVASKPVEQSIKAKAADTVKETVKPSNALRIVAIGVLILAVFFALRLTLRTISRKMNLKRKA